MKIIKDIKDNEEIIQKCIDKHGHAAEHHYQNYANSEVDGYKNVFFLFDNDMGIMAQVYKDKEWSMMSEVIAPEDKKLELTMKFIDYCLIEKKGKKVVFELTKSSRKKLLEHINDTKFRACRLNYSLYWPMFDLKVWDESLHGKVWKKLRNLRNRFMKKYDVNFVSPHEYPKKVLKKLVDKWINSRKCDDGVDEQEYYNFIENDFKGCDCVRLIVIDDKPCSLTAGWKVPNTDIYYSSIGIYDYDYEGIGEFSNIDDLSYLKKKNYSLVDFGGSDKSLLNFKNKFKPNDMYSTHIFSVVLEEGC